MVVDKSAITMRDSEGKLLPMEIESKEFGGTIKLIPLTEGELNEIKANSDKVDEDKFIYTHLVEPKLTIEEVNVLPPISKRELSICLIVTTGADRETIETNMKKAINKVLDDQKKKSTA